MADTLLINPRPTLSHHHSILQNLGINSIRREPRTFLNRITHTVTTVRVHELQNLRVAICDYESATLLYVYLLDYLSFFRTVASFLVCFSILFKPRGVSISRSDSALASLTKSIEKPAALPWNKVAMVRESQVRLHEKDGGDNDIPSFTHPQH